MAELEGHAPGPKFMNPLLQLLFGERRMPTLDLPRGSFSLNLAPHHARYEVFGCALLLWKVPPPAAIALAWRGASRVAQRGNDRGIDLELVS
jgi:hypothetical protein